MAVIDRNDGEGDDERALEDGGRAGVVEKVGSLGTTGAEAVVIGRVGLSTTAECVNAVSNREDTESRRIPASRGIRLDLDVIEAAGVGGREISNPTSRTGGISISGS